MARCVRRGVRVATFSRSASQLLARQWACTTTLQRSFSHGGQPSQLEFERGITLLEDGDVVAAISKFQVRRACLIPLTRLARDPDQCDCAAACARQS